MTNKQAVLDVNSSNFYCCVAGKAEKYPTAVSEGLTHMLLQLSDELEPIKKKNTIRLLEVPNTCHRLPMDPFDFSKSLKRL